VSVTNGRDDLRVAVKCQANPEIAGSPRNVFRYSLGTNDHGGGSALERRWGFPLTDPSQTTNAAGEVPGVRLRELSSVVERETAQTAG
jgi:hypothetical protein